MFLTKKIIRENCFFTICKECLYSTIHVKDTPLFNHNAKYPRILPSSSIYSAVQDSPSCNKCNSHKKYGLYVHYETGKLYFVCPENICKMRKYPPKNLDDI